MKNILREMMCAVLCLALLFCACAAAEGPGYEAARAKVPAEDAVLKETETEGPYTEYTFWSASENAEWEVYVDANNKVARVHLDYESRDPGPKKLNFIQATEALYALVPDAVITHAQEEPEDDGVQYRLFYSLPDGTSGMVELDAATGQLLEMDVAYDDASIQVLDQAGKANLTGEAAKALVLSKVTDGKILEFKEDTEDGRAVFEGKVSGKEGVYEFEIDVATGIFTEWEIDD